MRKKSLALILALLLCGTQVLVAQQQNPPAPSPPPPAAPQEQQEMQKGPTIRVPVNLVDVLFTVLNRRNKLVSDLEQKDFRVLDDNVPQDIPTSASRATCRFASGCCLIPRTASATA